MAQLLREHKGIRRLVSIEDLIGKLSISKNTRDLSDCVVRFLGKVSCYPLVSSSEEQPQNFNRVSGLSEKYPSEISYNISYTHRDVLLSSSLAVHD